MKTADKPIVLYGMGNGADLVLSACEKYGIKVSGVFASDGFVREKTFHGMPVTDYKTARAAFGEMAVLLCFGTALPGVIDNIKRIAGENRLFAPDVPVCGDGLFCAEYYDAHKSEFDGIYTRLADEVSRNTFENIVNFKLTGDINYLFACETGEDEPYDSFLRLSGDETYLDLGAYRGDTVFSFIKRVGQYKKIIAVEPDKKTFAKLCAATRGVKNIRNINAFAGEKPGTAGIFSNGSRGMSSTGTAQTAEIITVDGLVEKPTFIKIDIEGGEAAAIKGAAETIKRCRPKMQIAAYHRAGDLIDLPKAVLDVREDYKIYLRHNPCLPAWDVNYFFI